MAWLLLFTAGCVEIIFALSLKYNEGFTKLWPSVLTLFSGAGSFYLLSVGDQILAAGNGLCRLDRHGGGRCCHIGYYFVQGIA